MKKYISSFSLIYLLLLAPVSLLRAQNTNVGIGQWRVHLPYNQGTAVAETGTIVYCASLTGLFSYNKDDGSVTRFSRINGLSDFQIQTIRYDPAVGILVIAYQDANIDLLYNNGSVINLSDIKRQNLSGNITINDIWFPSQATTQSLGSDHFAFLSCGFGIVILDLDLQQVYDTWYIGPAGSHIDVNGITADNTYYYAATDSGIYIDNINDPLLFLYSDWSIDSTLPNPKGKYGSICSFNNTIYCSSGIFDPNKLNNDTIVLQQTDSGWSYFKYPGWSATDTKLMAYGNDLVVRNYFSITAYDLNLNQIYYTDYNSYPNGNQQEALVDANNVMYIADGNNGLVRDQQNNYTIIYPNGPSNIANVAMASLNDDVWVASGSGGSSYTAHSPQYLRNGIYHYSNNNWTSFNSFNTPLFDTLSFPDVIDIKCDPTDSKHVFVAGYGGGIFEFRDNAFVKRYDQSNSSLQPLAGHPGYYPILVGGLNFDPSDNLWVVSTTSGPSPLSVMNTDGSWQSFTLPNYTSPNGQVYTSQSVSNVYLFNLLVDNNNYKWFIISGIGIGVFYNPDNNPNDDQFVVLTTGTGYGNLPTSQIYSMAIDQDSTIWIGSGDGVNVFYSPQSVFQPTGFDSQPVLIQQGPYTQILLQNETVTAIAVDGANQKWFGTQGGGVFLTSSDGTTQILNFNTSNSPLLSNNITSIAIDQTTGEVFFGTDQGICSYRASATEGGDACQGYYVFPNPVAHGYSGLIAVRGLATNSYVKITDVSGNVVYETTSSGGQATWNGNNFQGQRAHSGVYLVFVSNDDGSSTCVTKFLMMN